MVLLLDLRWRRRRVRVNEDGVIVVAAAVPGDDVVDVKIAVGTDARCGRKVGTAAGQRASVARMWRAFEPVLAVLATRPTELRPPFWRLATRRTARSSSR